MALKGEVADAFARLFQIEHPVAKEFERGW